MNEPKQCIATRAVHSGPGSGPHRGAHALLPNGVAEASHSPALQRDIDDPHVQNPTRRSFERCVADLESGADGFAFASGAAAIATVLDLVGGDGHIVAGDDVYGGTRRMFELVRRRHGGPSISYVDQSGPENLLAAIGPQTRMVWVETPSNPLLKLADLRAIARMCKRRGLISVCDNTFATPMLQRPLELGFDITVHSTIKYLNGHADILGGAVVVGAEPHQREWIERLAMLQEAAGATQGPFNSFLALRGMRTLALRMERHCTNAHELASWLEHEPRVRRVIYPGLPSHAQHDLAYRQMNAFGSVVSIELDTDLDGARRFVERCEVFAQSASVGGVESQIEHPCAMRYASMPPHERVLRGVSDALLMLSIGVEDVDDLRYDLRHALAAL